MDETIPVQRVVSIRDVTEADLSALYRLSVDPESNRMAMVRPRGRESFDAHWASVLRSTDTVSKVILLGDRVVGKISCFTVNEMRTIGYWVDREYWGRGIATRALGLLVQEVTARPLHALVATTNTGSIRVLEKCGFVVIGKEHSPETERYVECDELILMLAE